MAWIINSSVADTLEDEINVGFSREDERSARAHRRAHKNNRKRHQEWDDEDDGWN